MSEWGELMIGILIEVASKFCVKCKGLFIRLTSLLYIDFHRILGSVFLPSLNVCILSVIKFLKKNLFLVTIFLAPSLVLVPSLVLASDELFMQNPTVQSSHQSGSVNSVDSVIPISSGNPANLPNSANPTSSVSPELQDDESDKASCFSVFKNYLLSKGLQIKYSSAWVSHYSQCPIENIEHLEVCFMRATFYPRGQGQQKTENYLVRLSDSFGSKVFTAQQVKMQESGSVLRLDLQPVEYSLSSEKGVFNRKKMQLTLANRDIVSQCLLKSPQGDFLKFN